MDKAHEMKDSAMDKASEMKDAAAGEVDDAKAAAVEKAIAGAFLFSTIQSSRVAHLIQ